MILIEPPPRLPQNRGANLTLTREASNEILYENALILLRNCFYAKNLYVCILDNEGAICVHKNIPASPEPLLKLIQPYQQDMVLSVKCMFSWYWVDDLCEVQHIEFVLGHALYMKAIHGGKAKNDKIGSHKIAVLLRGGMFPEAYVYPAECRGTCDLLRRRMHRMRKRAELLAHVQNTNSQ